MKILHLIKHIQFGHGNAHAAVDLACAQVASGNSVVLASGGGEFVELLERQGVAHCAIDQDSGVSGLLAAVSKIDRLVASFRPDVIHAHMVTSALLGRVPAWHRGMPLIATAHNPFDRQARLLRFCDVVVGVSSASAKQLATQVASTPVRTALNGTLGAPRRSFFPAERYSVAPMSVGTICGLHPRKGVEDLISAFAAVAGRFAQSHLYIAGDGPMRTEYQELARATGLGERICFMGQIRDSRQFLESLDIFVLASHAEGLALVLPEAREAGCAVVGTDVDGTPEGLDGGRAGMLVPPASPDRLAAALESLLASPAQLDEMQRQAMVGVQAFSVDRVAADYERIYREAMSTRLERSTGIAPQFSSN